MRIYTRRFFEDFGKADTERAIETICKILARQLGKTVSPVFFHDHVIKSDEGEVFGIIALVGNDEQIRFNFKSESSSARIISVDIWNKIKFQPDLSIKTDDISVIKIIPAIVKAFEEKKPDQYIFTEEMVPRTQGKVSKEISDSINAWSKEMEIDENKLKNTRLADLYKDYTFFIQEVDKANHKFISFASFRSYLIEYFDKYNIKNIYMRNVVITKAGTEKLAKEDSEQKKFDKEIYELTLADKMDFLKQSVIAVVRGYENSVIIAGMAGIGKTSSVKEIINDEDSQAKWVQGDIKNYGALYKLFYDNSDKLIVFDDTDSIFKKVYISILNAVMAPEKKRLVSFPAEFGKELPKGYKDFFNFTGKVIIITNMPKRKIAPSVLSRGAIVEINVSPSEVIDYIRQNIDKVMPDYPQATHEAKIEVLDFIEKIKGEILHIDFRLLKRCLIYFLSGSNNWKKYSLAVLRAY
jgi:hypothetical protein